MKVAKIPAKEAYQVGRCWDCPYFKEYGETLYGGDTCEHGQLHSPVVLDPDSIPDWCPIAVEI